MDVFFGKMSVQVLAHFKVRLFHFFAMKLSEFLIHLDNNPLFDIWFANIFSHSIGCHFILLILSFAVKKLFSLM